MAKEELLDDEIEAEENKRMKRLEKKFGHAWINYAGKPMIVQYDDSKEFYCLCPDGHKAPYVAGEDVYRCEKCGWTSPVLDENQNKFIEADYLNM